MATKEEIQELYNFCQENITYNADGTLTYKGFTRTKTDSKGYVVIKIKGKAYKQHRIVFLMHNGYFPQQVDHINRIKNDNRIENLRASNNSDNQKNVEVRKDSTSGYKGVYWRSGRNRWVARISLKNGKRKILGSFKCKHEAAKHYNKEIVKYYGEFAVLNKIKEVV